MPVQVIAFVTINEDNPLALAKYLETTTPLLEDAGAEIVQRFLVSEVVVGHKPAQSVVIVNYPSREAVDRVFKSAAYEALIPIRDKAFSEYHVSIAST